MESTPIPEEAPEPLSLIPDHGVTSEILFTRLCDKLIDRNLELGECFKTHIRFVNFEDQQLLLDSTAEGDASKILKIPTTRLLNILCKRYLDLRQK